MLDKFGMMPSMDQDDWPAKPGTYVIVMGVSEPSAVKVGKLGSFMLDPGQYAYIGSAHGPGGLRARLNRHLRANKPLRWHVDYLTTSLSVTYVYCVEAEKKRECEWVHHLLAVPHMSVPIPAFGSGDCREGCPAHLVRFPDKYDYHQLEEALGSRATPTSHKACRMRFRSAAAY